MCPERHPDAPNDRRLSDWLWLRIGRSALASFDAGRGLATVPASVRGFAASKGSAPDAEGCPWRCESPHVWSR
jgi:hypothetical protein